jgi:hypothetical protein
VLNCTTQWGCLREKDAAECFYQLVVRPTPARWQDARDTTDKCEGGGSVASSIAFGVLDDASNQNSHCLHVNVPVNLLLVLHLFLDFVPNACQW